MTWGRRLTAEALGTAFLLAIVVGSGIMAERLSSGNIALALLANALATGTGLFALIHLFGNVSGAHFNPAVSLAMALAKQLTLKETAGYIAAQFLGALLGVAIAHAMFDLAPFSSSHHVREGAAQVWSEFVATFGLVLVIAGVARHGLTATALAVATYITSAYWFTASTSFANPAVTLARAFTDSFSGIELSGVPWFMMAQIVAAVAAAMLAKWIWGSNDTPSL